MINTGKRFLLASLTNKATLADKKWSLLSVIEPSEFSFSDGNVDVYKEEWSFSIGVFCVDVTVICKPQSNDSFYIIISEIQNLDQKVAYCILLLGKADLSLDSAMVSFWLQLGKALKPLLIWKKNKTRPIARW